MICANCGADIAAPPFKIGIWVEDIGDENGFGYVARGARGYYTESSSRDSITAGDIEYAPRAISMERGEQIVRLIGACPDRSDKRRGRPAHEKFRRSPPPSGVGVAW